MLFAVVFAGEIVFGLVLTRRSGDRNLAAMEKRLSARIERAEARADSLAKLVPVDAITRIVTETNAPGIRDAVATARRALAVATKTADAFEPVSEQLQFVNGKVIALEAADSSITVAHSVLAGKVADTAQTLDAFRAETNGTVETVLRQTDAFGGRLDTVEHRQKALGKHQTISDVLNGMFHGISIIHIVGTKGQGANASVESKP